MSTDRFGYLSSDQFLAALGVEAVAGLDVGVPADPTSLLDVATADTLYAPLGSTGGYTVASHAASYSETATAGELIVKITASGQTVTLPTAVGNTAKLTFKLMVAGTLTIDGAGAETIDGAATASITSQYEALTLVSDNANWVIV